MNSVETLNLNPCYEKLSRPWIPGGSDYLQNFFAKTDSTDPAGDMAILGAKPESLAWAPESIVRAPRSRTARGPQGPLMFSNESDFECSLLTAFLNLAPDAGHGFRSSHPDRSRKQEHSACAGCRGKGNEAGGRSAYIRGWGSRRDALSEGGGAQPSRPRPPGKDAQQ